MPHGLPLRYGERPVPSADESFAGVVDALADAAALAICQARACLARGDSERVACLTTMDRFDDKVEGLGPLVRAAYARLARAVVAEVYFDPEEG